MSSRKSWYAQASSSTHGALSKSSHDLPKWRSPSPSASMIPPPIVQSRYMPPQDLAAHSVFVETPTEFEDKQQEIQADIQFLLDAQAEGLIRGLEGGSVEDRSSTGDTTPTARSAGTFAARRARRPPRRQLGLRSARKGLYNSIIALANLKNEELRDIEVEAHEHGETLGQIEAWEKKRQGLHEASRHIDSEEETIRIQRLKQEADALQVEINRVETSLLEMKRRRRQILRQAASVENTVQARLASYTESLRELDTTIESFLRVCPEGVTPTQVPSSVKASVWQLPPHRRNLDLAKEYWTEQREQAELRRKNSEFERSALVEGAGLWAEAVVEINEFEKYLRSETSALRPSSPNSQSAWEDPASDQMHQLIDKLDNVAMSLRNKLHKVEERNWKLLQAALGAELDALDRGKQILTGALVAAGGSTSEHGHGLRKADSSEEINALDHSFSTARHVDDEEPPPDLLFSRLDTDE